MNHVQQAKELKERIANALREVQRLGAPGGKSGRQPFNEQAVLSCYQTVIGVLNICHYHIMGLMYTWQEEDRRDSDDLDDLNEWALRE